MKDAMVRISQQNEQLMSQNEALWSRVNRLEDEKSNHTAYLSAESQKNVDHRSSGLKACDGNGGIKDSVGDDRMTLRVMKYKEGFQQGYLVAKDALEATQKQGSDSRSLMQHHPSLEPVSSPAPSF